jgi:hypothetical protein
VKPNEEWEAQLQGLTWKVSVRDGVSFDEARDRVIERAIRLGPSPANRKFYRMIVQTMRRNGLPFREAAAKVWDRCARFVIGRFLRKVDVI